MNLIRIFGSNVKKYRLQKGLSQEKLGEITNLHRTYISDIERCKRNASLDTIERMANALGVSADILLKEG